MIASHISTFALLQTAAPGGALPGLLFQVAAVSAIIYFFLIRPQQKQRKEHEERLRNLKRGDMVVTSGGIVGSPLYDACRISRDSTGAIVVTCGV